MSTRASTPRTAAELAAIENDTRAARERVRQRAYELSQRGPGAEDPIRNWLQAECDMLWRSPVTMRRTDGAYQIDVAVPGMGPKDVTIACAAGKVVVRGLREHEETKDDGAIVLREYNSRSLYREIPVPPDAQLDRIHARVADGELVLQIPRAGAAPAKAERSRKASAATRPAKTAPAKTASATREPKAAKKRGSARK